MGLSPRLYFPPLIHFVFLFGLKFLPLVAQNWWMNPFFMSVIFILFLFLSLWSFDTKFNALLSMSYQEHVKAHLPVDVSCDCEGIFWIYVSNKHSFGPLLVLGWMFYLAQIRGACYWILLQDMEYYNKLEEPTDEENDMLDLAFGLTETLVPFSWTLQWEFFITFNLYFFLFKALRFNPMFGILQISFVLSSDCKI